MAKKKTKSKTKSKTKKKTIKLTPKKEPKFSQEDLEVIGKYLSNEAKAKDKKSFWGKVIVFFVWAGKAWLASNQVRNAIKEN